ncbi:MAG TPA: DUF552 domain-containing protein [Methanothermococcus okinawensis]|uniref:DUF552 domain-containing protein n=1 Tax=Methanothermococcus okinawensis TaxID=155863 RepID=A0A832ZXB6_9EURY|nr:DUF552 domain-containing protein [Methanothermococcus okinawensis]
MVLKSLFKILKGEEDKVNFEKSNNDDILSGGPYVEIDVDDNVEEENIIKIKVLELENRKDANEILVWVENGCIVIAHTRNLEREIDEKYLEVIKYLKDEVQKMRGMVVKVCNDKILVLPRNVIIEKVVRRENQSIKEGEIKS